MTQQTLPFKHPKIDNEAPDKVQVKIAGNLEEVLRPLRRGEEGYLLIHFKAVDVAAKTKENEEDGEYVLRTVSLKPVQGFLLTEEVLEVAGVVLKNLWTTARKAFRRDQDLLDGKEALPLDMYEL